MGGSSDGWLNPSSQTRFGFASLSVSKAKVPSIIRDYGQTRHTMTLPDRVFAIREI